jgi:hypothetical protein
MAEATAAFVKSSCGALAAASAQPMHGRGDRGVREEQLRRAGRGLRTADLGGERVGRLGDLGVEGAQTVGEVATPAP